MRVYCPTLRAAGCSIRRWWFGVVNSVEYRWQKAATDAIIIPNGFSMWVAGAGVQGGRVLGATDDFGLRPVEYPATPHDINATILRLMGLDDTRLTYFYQGRDQRLTDVQGEAEFTGFLLKS